MTSSYGNISALLSFCAGTHRSPKNPPNRGQQRGTLVFLCWTNTQLTGNSRRQDGYFTSPLWTSVQWQYSMTVMTTEINGNSAIRGPLLHDDVIKWKHFPRNWPFVRGVHRSLVNSPHKGQWRGALMFSLICVWINDWVNNREAGDLRRYRAYSDVIVMIWVRHVQLHPWLCWPKSYCRYLIPKFS